MSARSQINNFDEDNNIKARSMLRDYLYIKGQSLEEFCEGKLLDRYYLQKFLDGFVLVSDKQVNFLVEQLT